MEWLFDKLFVKETLIVNLTLASIFLQTDIGNWQKWTDSEQENMDEQCLLCLSLPIIRLPCLSQSPAPYHTLPYPGSILGVLFSDFHTDNSTKLGWVVWLTCILNSYSSKYYKQDHHYWKYSPFNIGRDWFLRRFPFRTWKNGKYVKWRSIKMV